MKPSGDVTAESTVQRSGLTSVFLAQTSCGNLCESGGAADGCGGGTRQVPDQEVEAGPEENS